MRKLSICVPTYNRAHLIGPTLETILSQSYDEFELVVVDNASLDNTQEVVCSIRDPRIRYVRNPSNVGLVLNNNRCIEEASGEIIAIYHDDDFYDKDLVKKSIDILDKNPRVGVVCCAVDLVDPFVPERVLRRVLMPWDEVTSGCRIRQELLRRWDSPIPSPTAMVRRECYAKAGLWRGDVGGGSDRELWLRILRDWDLGYIAEPMVSLRERVKEVPTDAARAANWSRDCWDQLTGQVTIQRIHFSSDLQDAPLRLAVEEGRLRARTTYELWKWGLIMLTKANPVLAAPGPPAFRRVGMKASAGLYDVMRESQIARASLRWLVGAYRFAIGGDKTAGETAAGAGDLRA